MKYRFAVLFVVAAVLAAPLVAQEATTAPLGDAGQWIKQNHVHQMAGGATFVLAGLTGALGASLVAGWLPTNLNEVHGGLAYTTIIAGAATLGLGLTAYSDELDKVWPHAALMGLAEVGFLVNAAVFKPGSPEHQLTGALSVTSLLAGTVAIVIAEATEKKAN